MNLKQNNSLLRSSLLANAVFSSFSGIAMLISKNALPQHISLPPIIWVGIGIGLLSFAVILLGTAKKQKIPITLTSTIIFADFAWVIGVSAAALMYQDNLSLTGVTLIVAINVVVATLAVLQSIGLSSHLKK